MAVIPSLAQQPWFCMVGRSEWEWMIIITIWILPRSKHVNTKRRKIVQLIDHNSLRYFILSQIWDMSLSFHQSLFKNAGIGDDSFKYVWRIFLLDHFRRNRVPRISPWPESGAVSGLERWLELLRWCQSVSLHPLSPQPPWRWFLAGWCLERRRRQCLLRQSWLRIGTFEVTRRVVVEVRAPVAPPTTPTGSCWISLSR